MRGLSHAALGGANFLRSHRVVSIARRSIFHLPRPINLGIAVVPQQRAWVIERFGKFSKVLEPGLTLLIPLVDKVAYVHSLKEEAVPVANQTAITRDNVTLQIDGVLYVRIMDPYKASYGVEDPLFAITQLAQTSMRSELGKMTLDQTFKERDSLNHAVVSTIAPAAETWGIECKRYEIRDITAPVTVRDAMDKQAEAERRKRAMVLESEGQQLSEVNIADGHRQAAILASQGEYQEKVNRAKGEAEAALMIAKATAESIQTVADAIAKQGGDSAVALRIAEQYIAAFEKIAKETNTVVLPATANDVTGMVAQAMSIYRGLAVATTKSQEHK